MAITYFGPRAQIRTTCYKHHVIFWCREINLPMLSKTFCSWGAINNLFAQIVKIKVFLDCDDNIWPVITNKTHFFIQIMSF